MDRPSTILLLMQPSARRSALAAALAAQGFGVEQQHEPPWPEQSLNRHTVVIESALLGSDPAQLLVTMGRIPFILLDDRDASTLSERPAHLFCRLPADFPPDELVHLVARSVECHVAELALPEKTEMLEALVENTPVFVVFGNRDGSHPRVNTEFTRVTGWTNEDLQNVDILEACYPNPDDRRRARDFIEQSVNHWSDFELTTKSGEKRWVSWSNLTNSNGTRIGVGIDITNRIRQEDEARRYHLLQKQAETVGKMGSFRIELGGVPRLWSDGLFRLLGRDPIRGAPSFEEFEEEYVHPDDREHFQQGLRRLWQEPSLELRHRIVTAGGEVRHMVIWAQRILGTNEQPAQIVGLIQDVTETTRAVAQAHLNEERLRQIVQQMPVMLDAINEEGNIVAWNAECERVTGYAPEEVIGNPDIWRELYPDDRYRRKMFDSWRGLQDYRNMTWELVTKTGERRTIAWSNISKAYPIPGWAWWGVGADVTEQLQASQNLQRQIRQLEALNSVVAHAVQANDLDELLEVTLDRMMAAFDVPIGAIWMEETQLIRGVPVAHAQKLMARLCAQHTPIPESITVFTVDEMAQMPLYARMEQEVRAMGVHTVVVTPININGHATGSIIFATTQARHWQQTERVLLATLGKQLGVSRERIRLLQQIQRNAEQIEQIIDSVPDGMLLLNWQCKVLVANPAAKRYLADLATYDDDGRLTQLGGDPIGAFLYRAPEQLWNEVRVQNEERESTFQVRAQAIAPDDGSAGWAISIHDATVEREIQQQTQQQDQLAVVGQMAAGIAHDFNNIMAVITLYSQLAMHDLGLSERSKNSLQTVVNQAHRAAGLIEQILDFSRSAVLERTQLNLQPFLKELVKLLRRTLLENIAIKTDLCDEECIIHADPTRIQQALLNLAINARDAMPEGGELTIETTRIPSADPNNPDQVRIAVRDTGSGIEPDVLPHIFEPFFTTKQLGKGNGLGLAQVYGIVRQHDGEIGARSSVGSGTEFIINLPLIAGRSSDLPSDSPTQLTKGQGQCILVVEDDPNVQAAVVAGLETLGYCTLRADNGLKALKILEEHGHEIDLILSDLIMPEAGGNVLLRHLRLQRTAIPTIIMSGHALDMDVEDLRNLGMVRLLPKPIRLDTLSDAVVSVLAQ